MTYEKTIFIEKEVLEKINTYMREGKNKEKYLGESGIFSTDVYFENGYKMEIKCGGAASLFGVCDYVWAAAVLYRNNGEAACSLESGCFEDYWGELKDGENKYIVHVLEKA